MKKGANQGCNILGAVGSGKELSRMWAVGRRWEHSGARGSGGGSRRAQRLAHGGRPTEGPAVDKAGGEGLLRASACILSDAYVYSCNPMVAPLTSSN